MQKKWRNTEEIINENVIMAQLKGNSNIVSYEDHQIIPHEDGIGYDILIRMELLTPLIDRMVENQLTEKEFVKLGIDMCKALEVFRGDQYGSTVDIYSLCIVLYSAILAVKR